MFRERLIGLRVALGILVVCGQDFDAPPTVCLVAAGLAVQPVVLQLTVAFLYPQPRDETLDVTRCDVLDFRGEGGGIGRSVHCGHFGGKLQEHFRVGSCV